MCSHSSQVGPRMGGRQCQWGMDVYERPGRRNMENCK